MRGGFERMGAWFHNAFSEQALGRAVVLIMSGNVMSQVIILLALPVITRIYSPEQMSLLAVYVAILTMIAVVACLRFEIAIPIPKSDEAAINLVALALLSTLAVTALVVIILLVIWIAQIPYLTEHPLWRYVWLFPLGTLFAGFFATAQYWSVRQRRFSLIGRTRVFQAVVGVSAQIGAGLLNIIPLGLLLGHLLMTSAGFYGLFQFARKNERHLARAVSRERMRRAFLVHKDFPKFSVIEGLASTGAQQITIVLISVIGIGAEAGFFFLALRALSAPISLVTNAVSQVYLQRAPDHFRNGTLRQFTKKVLLAIVVIFVPPFMIFGIFSVPVFELVFGSEWGRAGEIAILMIPMYLFSLFSASIGMVMNVTGQQKAMMWMKLIGFAVRVGSALVAVLFFPSAIIEFYAVAGLAYYIMCSWAFYVASARSYVMT